MRLSSSVLFSILSLTFLSTQRADSQTARKNSNNVSSKCLTSANADVAVTFEEEQ